MSPYSQLFQYIGKNTVLPNKISELHFDQEPVQQLYQAIKAGDFNAAVFEDKDCYLYLLYLLKVEKIEFLHGMTVYSYLMALMQFTNKQPLKEDDNTIKKSRQVEVYDLAKNDQLTELGQAYLDSIIKKCEKLHGFDSNLAATQLKKLILNLPPTEQKLIKISYISFSAYQKNKLIPNSNKLFLDWDDMFDRLVANMPFLIHDAVSFHLPSYSVINALLAAISGENIMKLMPIFGIVGLKTLEKCHTQNLHPVSLYGLDVKNNLTAAHDLMCGPFAVWLHDIGHGFWSNLLTYQEKQFIYTEFLPKLRDLLTLAEKMGLEKLANEIKIAIYNANDFDLTPVGDYERHDVLPFFLAKTFAHNCSECNENETIAPIDTIAKDQLYYLLKKMIFEMQDSENKMIWIKIAAHLENLMTVKHTHFPLRSKEILATLEERALLGKNKPLSFPMSLTNEFVKPNDFNNHDNFFKKPKRQNNQVSQVKNKII